MPHEAAKTFAELPGHIISMVFSLLGIGFLIAWGRPLTKREQALTICAGIVCAAALPMILVPWLFHAVSPETLEWLPPIGFFYAVGGFVSGAIGIKVIAALFAFSDKLPSIAERTADRIGGDK